jgi:hypothetical protein
MLILTLGLASALKAQQPMSSQQKAQLNTTINALQAEERAQANAVDAYIKQTGAPRRVVNEEGITFELRRIVNGQPQYDMTYNRQAAISTGTNHVHADGRSGFDLMGTDMIVGEWDGGGTLTSHVEFGGRAIQRDNPFAPSNHATHVAGTLIAAGINPEAKGMAPEATLWAHDWNSDGSEMAQAASEGLLISNHSYGTLAGWARGDWSEEGNFRWHWWGDVNIDAEEDYKFGFYDQRAASWDRIAHDAPNYLIVKSAGNNRNDNHNGTHVVRINGEWVESDDFRQASGGADGFDCLPTYSTSKNILTVGAVGNVNGGYSGPSSVNMTSFSSWGPTDDGRIKPDIVGDGVQLLSANNSGNTDYGRSSGTSMSGPNVAGSLILLQQLHREMTGEFILSSSLKGLAIHTADDAGNPGPDYSYGWGLLNTESAAEVLAQPLRHPFIEENLNPADTFTYSIMSDGETPVRTTLCWTDPAGQVSAPALNDRTPRLVNDLDVRLIAVSGPDSGTVYLPFTLDPDNPGAEAQPGDNFRDNVEMIDAGILPAGDYIVQVHHKNTLQDNEAQTFSLWISAPVSDCSFTLAVDTLAPPPCPDTDLAFVAMRTEDASGPVTFFLDDENRGPDSILTPIRTGRVFISAIDSAGCFASTDVVVERPEGLSFGEFDRVVARIHEPRPERNEFTFSSAFNSGWGANTNAQWWRAPALAADDGSGDPILGCGAYENDSLMNGKIAIVRRGECQFGEKALQAQNAGALACIIINSEEGVIQMAPGDDGDQITIPVFMIPQSQGNALLDLMADTAVSLTLGRVQETQSPNCAGVDNGLINVYTLPEMEDVQFEWNTGDSTENLTDLGPGNYALTITDARGCTYEQEYVLSAPDTIDLAFDRVERVTCPDTLDGQATVIPTGGQVPYQFTWSSGEQSSSATALAAGWNQVSITDAQGCLRIDSVEVPAAVPLAVAATEVFSSCLDTAVGSVRLQPTGTAPFSVLWGDSLIALERSDLSVGWHNFTLSDACSRVLRDSVQVSLASDSLVIESNVSAADCANQEGRIGFQISAGRGPYVLQWSNGETTNTMGVGGSTFPAGWYSASVSDVCGTEVTIDSFLITAPAPIAIEFANISGESCPGASDGSIDLRLSGGTGNLTPTLNPSDSLFALSGGTYFLSVQDENQCVRDTAFTIPSPDTLEADFDFEADGYQVMFFDQSEAAENYEWNFGDGNTSSEASPTHIYNDVGQYEVCLRVQNACGEEERCQQVNVVLLSNPNARPQVIQSFPNPVRDRLTVILPTSGGTLQIFSALGQPVWDAPAQLRQDIKVSQWTPGMYFLRWQGQTYRVVKH